MPMDKKARFTVPLGFLAFSPVDASTQYFTGMMKAPGTGEGSSTFGVMSPCTITGAFIVMTDTVDGTNEAWSLYVRKNASTDYLIATVSTAVAPRTWKNTNMSVPMAVGDTFEIKMVCPTWATNPTNVSGGGYLLITSA
jgi:hypothetical protein